MICAGLNRDSRQWISTLFVKACSLGDPAFNLPVPARVRFEFPSAAVRDEGRSLEQEQALVRCSRCHAPAAGLHHERLVIAAGVVTEDAQLEPVLPLGFAVAAARVARGLGEDWQHVPAEGDGNRTRNAVDLHGNRRDCISTTRLYLGPTIAERCHLPGLGDFNNAFWNNAIANNRSQVRRKLRIGVAPDQHLFGRFGSREPYDSRDSS